MPPFSLLMAVYGANGVRELERAVQSGTIEQTLPPSQLVIVRDGPVPVEIQRFLDTLQQTLDVWFSISVPARPAPHVTVVALEENGGLAHALNEGLGRCDYDIVARADADDLSQPQRFATQLALFAGPDGEAPDVAGSAIQEYSLVDGERQLGQVRLLPAGGEELMEYARMQSPVHHPSVVYRKAAVLAAGGYPEGIGRFEDYLLWEKMIVNGARFANVAEPLVLYRADDGAFERRGGRAMLRDEWRLQRTFRADRFTTRWQFVRNVATRAIYRIVPTSIREKAYRKVVARRNATVGPHKPKHRK